MHDFTRSPSVRYQELVAMYRDLHEHGDRSRKQPAANTFTGFSLYEEAQRIAPLVRLTESKRLLDYGCGKGKQYDDAVVDIPGQSQKLTIIDFWGVDVVHCYDPGYAPFSRQPDGTFDGVICTDVLEHCAEQDIPWVLSELFNYSERFVFASIAAYPANKILPNGDNAHITVRSLGWWRHQFTVAAAAKPNVLWEIWVEERLAGAPASDTRYGNFIWLDAVQRIPRV